MRPSRATKAAVVSGLSMVLGVACAGCGSSDDAGAGTSGDAAIDAHAGLDAAVGAGGGDANPSGTGDAGAPDAPGDGFEAGAPITAPAEQWTWIPFPDAFCGDGSPTGIGVNLKAGATRVFFYLEGGGACWSDETCYTSKTAANFTSGYDAAAFAGESTGNGYLAATDTFFDRNAPPNPFKDASFVYVPYCTGDIHAGDNLATYGTKTGHHVGYRNIAAFLKRVVPSFPAATRVFLAGSSAGGFGALYNWGQVQAAFGGVRVDLIDDSGTFMPNGILAQAGSPFESLPRAAWNLAATLPPGCGACTTRLDALYDYFAKAFPDHRGALLSYSPDSVLPQYFGITATQFTTGLEEELSAGFAPNANLKSFVVGKSGHVLLSSPLLAQGSTTVLQFVTSMTTDDPAWASVHP